LGFAIPIETAARIANELFTKGRAEHPFLGISMTDLSPTTRRELNQEKNLKIQPKTGVVISGVMENSPAEESGLLPGDVIQKINGKPVKTAALVQKQIESSTVGDILEIEVNRNGKIQTLKVESGSYPEKK
jgi:S1-C subfamily serine protease